MLAWLRILNCKVCLKMFLSLSITHVIQYLYEASIKLRSSQCLHIKDFYRDFLFNFEKHLVDQKVHGYYNFLKTYGAR